MGHRTQCHRQRRTRALTTVLAAPPYSADFLLNSHKIARSSLGVRAASIAVSIASELSVLDLGLLCYFFIF